MAEMIRKETGYEIPLAEIVPVEAEHAIAASNLENPQNGGEWEWD